MPAEWAAARAGFLEEAGAAVLVLAGVLGENFEGHEAVELAVAGLEDFAHAPGAEALDDLVLSNDATDQRTLRARDRPGRQKGGRPRVPIGSIVEQGLEGAAGC